MDALYTEWTRRWQAAVDACERMGSFRTDMVIGPPASSNAVSEMEVALGQPLPASFRKVLLDFSAEVEIRWFLADGIYPPEPCPQITYGGYAWSLSRMTEIAHWYQAWLKVFDINDPYNRIWYGKLAFMEVGNGDNIAFNPEHAQDAPVIYLSHDGGDAHGYCLGKNFVDFIERHSLLGFAGPAGWNLMPFLPDAMSGLDAYGENSQKWREWFGLDFEAKSHDNDD
ncbi:MAG: SMI1/KNR4 family protein [Janthinobacterium lividum]